MKSNKGCFGYFSRERIRRLIVTVILFAIPLLIFFTGLIRFGDRQNLFTVIAVVGCLPACKSLVGLIMVFLHKSIPQSEYEKISSHAGDLTMSYEMYLTSEKKNGYVDAFVICGNQVVGYSSDPKIDCGYIANLVEKILHNNGFKVHVMILRDLNPYLDRLDSLRKNREALEKDPSQDALVRTTILAISL